MAEQIKNEPLNEEMIKEARNLEKSFQENTGEWNDIVYSYFDHSTGYTHTGKKLDECHILDKCDYHGASVDGTDSWTVIQVGDWSIKGTEQSHVHLFSNKFEEIAKKIVENEGEGK